MKRLPVIPALAIVLVGLGTTACGSSARQAHPAFVRRAVAALGVGPIMHVVIEQPTGMTNVNLRTGRSAASVVREELWTDRTGHRIHLVMSEDGRVVGDLLLPRDAARNTSTSQFPPDPAPALASFWTGYRAALKSGSAELDGRGTLRGRPVYWLRFKPAHPSGPVSHPPTLRIALDAHSYEPVLVRTTFNGRHFDERILAAKAIRYDPADFRGRGPNFFASARLQGNSSWETGTSTSHPYATPNGSVRPPWLTAGKTVARLELGAVIPLTATRKHKPAIHGVELVYGPIEDGLAGTSSTTVDELPRGDPSEDWNSIPADSVQVEMSRGQSTSESVAHPHPRTTTVKDWTGYMRKNDLYIKIDTPKGERALLDLARGLHRARS
jgi:hypothetical protein